jgi:3-phytase/alkaline phosphatase D
MDTQIRVATFNASLNRPTAGGLVNDLSTPDNAQAKAVAEIIQRAAPDIVLVNEFDFDAAGPNGRSRAAELFRNNSLEVSQNGAPIADYPYYYIAPSNTGIASGFDLNNNGTAATTPGAPGYGDDALGFGAFPGQFGMVIYSKYPIDMRGARTFQHFLWKDMPDARLPDDAATPQPHDWYSPAELDVLPLSSKSHWDIPVNVNGEIVHILAAHPTPPVFDGPEDRNGLRNADEIRFWDDYVTPGQGGYIYDDKGRHGGLAPGERFVIVGDYNADPDDGDSVDKAVQQILLDPSVDASVIPTSPGGVQQSALQGGANATHTGNPAYDTADFADTTPGNLRSDYVLPSQVGLDPVGGSVFWPRNTDPRFPLVGTFDPALPGGFPSSDHRLVEMDLVVKDDQRREAEGLEFLGEISIPTGRQFDGTEVGGLSGITYDPGRGVYYAISDDRSQIDPARFYTLTIALADGALTAGDVKVTDVTTLLGADGKPFPASSLDPEGIAFTDAGLFVSSEGDANALISPFVDLFSLQGEHLAALPIDPKFRPTANHATGIRNNLAFESLTVTPDKSTLYTATENALFQDGPEATLDSGSASRIVKYDVASGREVAEYVYVTEPVAAEPVPAGSFSTNGLVDLLAMDDDGTLLALERGFSTGVGNTLKIFEVRTQGATDVRRVRSLETEIDDGELEVNLDQAVQKELLFDLADLGIPLDNIEGISFGPKLADGRQSIVLVSDNNFAGTQSTQFFAFAIDLQDIPTIAPVLETPPESRFADPTKPIEGPDPDDPAIWLNPRDPNASVIVTSHKEGGLRVYDLAGHELQAIEPKGIRYNNVDVVYNVALGGVPRDLFVASDRANDTLAIYAINPLTRKLREVTSASMPANIFGVDDGDATAYGLAAFTAADGTNYVFVTQAADGKVAQLKLVEGRDGGVSAQLVRTLLLPNPGGLEPEELQSEGLVIDQTTGFGYVSMESGGIWRFSTDPQAGSDFVQFVPPDADFLEPDLEGLSIRYADDGSRQMFVSSQGDSTFSVLDLDTGAFLGRFAVARGNRIDGVEESDGLDIFSGPLGHLFPDGLLVVQDGSNEPQNVFPDPEDGEIQNFDANFKLVDLGDALAAVGVPRAASSRDPHAGLSDNGVASGEVTRNSAMLWAHSVSPGTVRFEVATDARFSHIVARKAVDSLGVAPVHVAVGHLQAGAHYYYRAIAANGDTSVGRFNTAQSKGYHGLSFGVSGDWRGGLTPYAALKNADIPRQDFFVQLGDTIYSDVPSPDLPLDQAKTLGEFRLKYDETLSDRGGQNFLADLRGSTAVYAMIDDHEVTNDFAGGAPPSSDPRFDTAGADFINETQLYKNGLQAFHDYQPIEQRVWAGTGDDRVDGAPDLYRTQNYGNDAAVFAVDERSFRDQELKDANPANPADIGRFLAQSFDPGRTMLGDPQLERLKQDLLAAQQHNVLWKFVMLPEPIQNLGVVAAADRYEGYAAERTELLKFIDDHDIANVVFVSADIHGTTVNNLTYQTSPSGPQIALDAWEISTGAVAYSPALGPTVVGLATAAGLLTPAQAAFYATLPVASDKDSIVNDKDDFLKSLINGQLDLLGYDHLGLNDNLAVADGLVDAKLLAGDYVAAHTFGWTSFQIDPDTHALRVTTFGVPTYTEAEAAAHPAAIAARTPVVVSRFEAYADQTLKGTREDDTIAGGNGDDLVSGGWSGRDTLSGMAGDDVLRGGIADDVLDGGADDDILNGGFGADRFTFVGTDLHGTATDKVEDLRAFTQGDRLVFSGFAVGTFAGTVGGNALDVSDDGRAVTIDSFRDLVELDDASAKVTITHSGRDLLMTIADHGANVHNVVLSNQWMSFHWAEIGR